MIDKHVYNALKPSAASYLLTLVVLIVLVVAGAWCAWLMEHNGHQITGMNNHVIWGMPHVFAIFLIVSASGALNVASLSTVFGQSLYKPYARLSVALSIALLVGGLMILVFDLGRPDRLIVAITTWNFRSVFAWNILFYTGFIVLGVAYLSCLIERRYQAYSRSVGWIAMFWRLALTTATGSIFGFLVGRDALDSALLAPMFIAMSLAFGTAIFVLSGAAVCRWSNVDWSETLRQSVATYLLWFVLAMGYFTIVHHLTNLYVREHRATELAFFTGSLSLIFWIGHVMIGVVVPVWLTASFRRAPTMSRLIAAASVVILGGLCHVYTIVIGSQFRPQRLFPDKLITDSHFGDAGFPAYVPSWFEFGLGFAGIACAALLLLMAMRVFPFVPAQSDPSVDGAR